MALEVAEVLATVEPRIMRLLDKNSHPVVKGQKTAIQINAVDIDHRGLVYASDRVGTGLFVIEYTGRKPARTNSQ